ncbi:MAG: hypothetical protein CMN75_04430 [Spirochaeta sp.]|nr:hypothetical protein [Spirochaeta sp.]RPG07258.1 MAG: hypothetical protein CBC32_009905 [Proteobacteria bacterium TMED72]
MIFRLSVLFLFLMTSMSWVGCSSLMSSATTGVAKNLTSAVLNQDDVLLVKEGAPAYLIAIDGLVEGDPKNQTLLLAGAQLYSAYASSFVTDPVRASRLSTKAKNYGWKALCLRSMELCEASRGRFSAFETALASTDRDDVPTLYGYGAAWAGWVQINAADWNAVAELPKVQALMERVVALEPGYDNGRADLYLGVLYTLRPASLGGRPELGRKYFERAIELSKGKDLLAKVLMADQYARLVFDQSLHDQLLEEVIAADPVAPGYTLSNTIAQEQARELLAESNEYF